MNSKHYSVTAIRLPEAASIRSACAATVGRLGMKTAQQLQSTPDTVVGSRIHIFKIDVKTAHEIALGKDDSQLDIRLPVLHDPATAAAGSTLRLTRTTPRISPTRGVPWTH
jgi:hypothetical protein